MDIGFNFRLENIGKEVVGKIDFEDRTFNYFEIITEIVYLCYLSFNFLGVERLGTVFNFIDLVYRITDHSYSIWVSQSHFYRMARKKVKSFDCYY